MYAVFERVLTPDMVTALTYNSVFGKLWRAVCRDRQVQPRPGGSSLISP